MAVNRYITIHPDAPGTVYGAPDPREEGTMTASTRPPIVFTEDDYVFIPLLHAIVPPTGIIEHLDNRWWSVHPDKGLVFFNPVNRRTGRRRNGRIGAPQCNSSEAISRKVAEYHPFPHEIIFIESVFIPVDVREFC